MSSDNSTAWAGRYPGWALVTGASAGLGACFARALAARGMPVALAARRVNRLESVAEEIRRTFGVQAIAITVELTNDDFLDTIEEGLDGREVGMLVNNAGFGLAMPFHQSDYNRLDRMVRLNCLAPTLLARRFLPPMIERYAGKKPHAPLDIPAASHPASSPLEASSREASPPRVDPEAETMDEDLSDVLDKDLPKTPVPEGEFADEAIAPSSDSNAPSSSPSRTSPPASSRNGRPRGAHILLGSVAGFQPVGHFATYAATKSYNMMLGEALWAEQRRLGIDTLVVAPGVTATEFQAVSGTRHTGSIALPEAVVEGALRALGRRPTYVPGLDNKITAQIARFLPRGLVALLAERVARRLLPPDALARHLATLRDAAKND